MSIESVSWALNVDDPDLSPTDRLTLIGVANHDGDGGAWPSLATLARYTGTTVRTVRRSLAKLEQGGYLTRHVNDGGTDQMPKDRRPNRYVLHTCAQPVEREDTSVRPSPQREDTSVRGGGTPVSGRGGTPVSSEPSLLTVHQPSPTTSLYQLDARDDDRFDEWWDIYPRKVAKKDAQRAWSRMNDEQRGTAIDVLPNHIALWRTEGRGTRTVPYPATWLNRASWTDELAYVPERVTASDKTTDTLQRLATGELTP